MKIIRTKKMEFIGGYSLAGLKIGYSEKFVDDEEMIYFKDRIRSIHGRLHSRQEYEKMPLGWLDLPLKTGDGEINCIVNAAERIREISQIVISLGIGGSYLGSRAAIEMIGNNHSNSDVKLGNPQVIFAGNNISGTYLQHIIDSIEDKDFSLCVISKSGTTLETAVAFRILKNILEKRYGKEGSRRRIIAVTDKSRGALRKTAEVSCYESFEIPDNVGGRYSVLTPAGLFAIAAAGINIKEIIEGARDACHIYDNEDMDKNPCYKYVVLRNIFNGMGKSIESLISYEPSMEYFAKWWQQLFGESEGKEGKGIFPTSLQFTTDLHSMGQYLQEGRKNIFETILNIENPRKDVAIPFDSENMDDLNYLENKTLNYINAIASQGVREAHENGGVPAILIDVPSQNGYYFGHLVYFFQKACAVSGYLIDVNPFDQPGVEMYKKNIYKLLGR